jgi:hypothetical protein
VTAIVTGSMTSFMTSAPAAAEIVTVCGLPSAASPAGSVLAGPIQRLGGNYEAEIESLLALSRDNKGFDILLHWGETSQSSIREQGAESLALLLVSTSFTLSSPGPGSLSISSSASTNRVLANW